MTPHALAATLISHAAGLTSDTAATELICAHHTWLTRTDFTWGAPSLPDCGPPVGSIRKGLGVNGRQEKEFHA